MPSTFSSCEAAGGGLLLASGNSRWDLAFSRWDLAFSRWDLAFSSWTDIILESFLKARSLFLSGSYPQGWLEPLWQGRRVVRSVGSSAGFGRFES